MTPDQIRAALAIAEQFKPGEAFLDPAAVLRCVSRGALPVGTEGPLTPQEAVRLAGLPDDAIRRVAHRLKLPKEAGSLMFRYMQALHYHALAIAAASKVRKVKDAFESSGLADVTGRAGSLSDILDRIESEPETTLRAVILALANLQAAFPWLDEASARAIAADRIEHSVIPNHEKSVVASVDPVYRRQMARVLLGYQLALAQLKAD